MKKLVSIVLAFVIALSACMTTVFAENGELKKITGLDDLTDGGVYVLAMDGITPTGYSSGMYAMKSEAVNNYTLSFAPFDTAMTPTGFEWVIASSDSGYTIRAKGSSNDGKYLNVNNGALTLSETEQVLLITKSGSKFIISSGDVRARFTNSNGVGFTGGTNTSSSEFVIYHEVETGEAPYEEMDPPTTEPLLVIGAISDLHIDYNIQNQNPPIRQSTIKACSELAEENLDVLLVGGDITSNNQWSSWTEDQYKKIMNQVRTTTKTAVESGRVLYVTGNHDYAVGGTNFNSGDYSWIMKEDVGEFVNALYMDEAQKYLLAYHYVIDGFHFIMINTPYSGSDNHSNYVYTPETVTWVENELASIGKDKTVFVMAHYPFRDSNGISRSDKGMSNNDSLNDNFKSVLLKYPNVIYLYGHDHGGPYIDSDILERLTPYTADGTPLSTRKTQPDGFISCFVGSMAYYSGSLNANDPEIVQALVIKVYEDRVVFEMKNYGVKTGSEAEPKSYTVARTVATDQGIDEEAPENDAVTLPEQDGAYEVPADSESNLAIVAVFSVITIFIAIAVVAIVLYKKR